MLSYALIPPKQAHNKALVLILPVLKNVITHDLGQILINLCVWALQTVK